MVGSDFTTISTMGIIVQRNFLLVVVCGLIALIPATSSQSCTIVRPATPCQAATSAAGSVSTECTLTLKNYVAANRNFSRASYTSSGLTPFFKLSKGIIGLVAKTPPWKAIQALLKGQSSQGVNEIIQWDKTRFFIALGFGILWMLVSAIGGFCYCCCRCTGRCGGGPVFHEKKSDETCKFLLLLFTGLVCCFMLGSSVLMYLTNARVGEAVGVLETIVTQSIERLEGFSNDTAAEISFVTGDQISFLTSQMLNQISSLGNDAGLRVQADFATPVNATAASVLTLAGLASSGLASLRDVQQRTARLMQLRSNVTKSLNASKISPCMASMPCATLNTNLGNIINAVPNYAFPDLSSTVTSVETVVNQNISKQVESGLKIFREIPCRILNQTQSVRNDVAGVVNNYQSQINTRVQPLIAAIGPNLTARLNVNSWRKQVDSVSAGVKKYDTFRKVFGYVLACFSVVVLLFMVGGISCGCCGQDNTTKPYSRSCASNCGGKVMIVGVYFAFLFMTLLMLLCTVTFFIGGHLHVVCPPLRSLEFFTQTLDNVPDVQSTYLLGTVLHGNGSVNVTIRSVLESCEARQSSYVALQLERRYNISSILESSTIINQIDQQLSRLSTSFSIDPSSILSQAARSSLLSFNSSGIQTINATGILQQANASLISNTSVTTTLTAYDMAYGVANLSDKSVLNTSRMHFVNAVNFVRAAEMETAKLGPIIAKLQVLSATLSTQIDATLKSADNLTAQVQRVTSSIANTTAQIHGTRLKAWVNQFFAFAIKFVTTKSANCRPLYDIYASTESFLCDFTVDTLNGFWLACGWGAFFFIPAIFLGTALSRYFVRLRNDDPFDDSTRPMSHMMSEKSPRLA